MHAWLQHWCFCFNTAAKSTASHGLPMCCFVHEQVHVGNLCIPQSCAATVCRHEFNNKKSWRSYPYCLATPPMHLVAMPSRKMSLCFLARVRASSQHCTFLPEFTGPPIGRHDVTSSAVRSRNHALPCPKAYVTTQYHNCKL